LKNVYIVQHVHEFTDGTEDVKIIGIYKLESDALSAVARLQNVNGFNKHIDGFNIDKYELNKDHWSEGFE